MITTIDKIRRSLVNVMRTDPFYSIILLNLQIVEENGWPTMSTNGKQLFYNTTFVDACSTRKLDIVLVHEALHIAMAHTLLLKTKRYKEPVLRTAFELAVNSLIIDRIQKYLIPAGEADLIYPGAVNTEFENYPIGKNSEWYYAKLMQDNSNASESGANEGSRDAQDISRGGSGGDDVHGKPEGGKAQIPDDERGSPTGAGAGDSEGADSQPGSSKSLTKGNDPKSKQHTAASTTKADRRDGPDKRLSKLGSVEEYPYDDKETPQEADNRYKALLSNARQAVAGDIPGGLEELFDGLFAVKPLPWYIILRDYLTRNIRTGRSFRRPNRRTLSRGDIAPSKLNKGLGTLLVMTDTSRSMPQEAMNKALGTCLDVGKRFPNFKLGILQFDTIVTQIDWFERYDANIALFKDWKWKGRGGTKYQPPFKALRELKPDVCLVITDGFPRDDWPDLKSTRVPVIWLITNSKCNIPEAIVKYSRVIRLNN